MSRRGARQQRADSRENSSRDPTKKARDPLSGNIPNGSKREGRAGPSGNEPAPKPLKSALKKPTAPISNYQQPTVTTASDSSNNDISRADTRSGPTASTAPSTPPPPKHTETSTVPAGPDRGKEVIRRDPPHSTGVGSHIHHDTETHGHRTAEIPDWIERRAPNAGSLTNNALGSRPPESVFGLGLSYPPNHPRYERPVTDGDINSRRPDRHFEDRDPYRGYRPRIESSHSDHDFDSRRSHRDFERDRSRSRSRTGQPQLGPKRLSGTAHGERDPERPSDPSRRSPPSSRPSDLPRRNSSDRERYRLDDYESDHWRDQGGTRRPSLTIGGGRSESHSPRSSPHTKTGRDRPPTSPRRKSSGSEPPKPRASIRNLFSIRSDDCSVMDSGSSRTQKRLSPHATPSSIDLSPRRHSSNGDSPGEKEAPTYRIVNPASSSSRKISLPSVPQSRRPQRTNSAPLALYSAKPIWTGQRSNSMPQAPHPYMKRDAGRYQNDDEPYRRRSVQRVSSHSSSSSDYEPDTSNGLGTQEGGHYDTYTSKTSRGSRGSPTDGQFSPKALRTISEADPDTAMSMQLDAPLTLNSVITRRNPSNPSRDPIREEQVIEKTTTLGYRDGHSECFRETHTRTIERIPPSQGVSKVDDQIVVIEEHSEASDTEYRHEPFHQRSLLPSSCRDKFATTQSAPKTVLISRVETGPSGTVVPHRHSEHSHTSSLRRPVSDRSGDKGSRRSHSRTSRNHY